MPGSSVKTEAKGREQRLLDAAGRLFLHFGFDKVTVADIAAEAGVSKGAVYLHFASKQALLETLIVHHMQVYAQAWAVLVETDPGGGSVGGMYRCALRALHGNAVMAALLRRDAHVFGQALRRPDGLLAASRSGNSRRAFVEAMQATGAIRRDVDPAVTAHIMNMLSYGLVSMAQVMDSRDIPPIDALLDGIAEVLDRALTPADGGNAAAARAIVRSMVDAGADRLARAREGAARAQ